MEDFFLDAPGFLPQPPYLERQKKNSWASSMPGWDATNRRTTERCPPKAASCKARWPSSVLTVVVFLEVEWTIFTWKKWGNLFIFLANSWKKNAGLGYSEVMKREKGWEKGTFPLAFENVRSWPGQGHLLSQASPRWLLQALSRATRWLLSDHDDWPSAMGSFPKNLSFFRVKIQKWPSNSG